MLRGMSHDDRPASPREPRAIVVARREGAVAGLNRAARALLGGDPGGSCWEIGVRSAVYRLVDPNVPYHQAPNRMLGTPSCRRPPRGRWLRVANQNIRPQGGLLQTASCSRNRQTDVKN